MAHKGVSKFQLQYRGPVTDVRGIGEEPFPTYWLKDDDTGKEWAENIEHLKECLLGDERETREKVHPRVRRTEPRRTKPRANHTVCHPSGNRFNLALLEPRPCPTRARGGPKLY